MSNFHDNKFSKCKEIEIWGREPIENLDNERKKDQIKIAVEGAINRLVQTEKPTGERIKKYTDVESHLVIKKNKIASFVQMGVTIGHAI